MSTLSPDELGHIIATNATKAVAAQAAEWERECDDTDTILRALGLNPVKCRTDGGSLKVQMIVGALAKPAAAPEGWQLVPVEPTEAMWSAGRDPVMFRELKHYRPASLPVPAWQRNPDGTVEKDTSKGTTAVHVWRAMLAAAPRPAPAEPQPAAQQEPLCMCKDRALSACPGEWEPGCDLGNNPAHARPAGYTQAGERKPLTDEQIDRHSIAAVDCPPSSTVILVSSLRRLLGITATKGGR